MIWRGADGQWKDDGRVTGSLLSDKFRYVISGAKNTYRNNMRIISALFIISHVSNPSNIWDN